MSYTLLNYKQMGVSLPDLKVVSWLFYTNTYILRDYICVTSFSGSIHKQRDGCQESTKLESQKICDSGPQSRTCLGSGMLKLCSMTDLNAEKINGRIIPYCYCGRNK